MECSTNARLLFLGMWNFADDRGRLPFSPKTLKAQIFPGDNFTADEIHRMVVELSTNGLVKIYTVDGKDYLLVTGWHHQKIDKPQPAKYPGPLDDHSTNGPGMVSTDRIGEDRIRKKVSIVRAQRAPRTKLTYSEEFETGFWVPYPRSQNMSKKEAWQQWEKLDPSSREAACKAIEPFKKYLSSKPNLETVHACRFLSQRRFDGYSEAQPAPQFDVRRYIA